MSVKAIRNHIIFKFERDVVRTNGDRVQFEESTDWGFDLGKADQGFDQQSQEAQWAIVVQIGHQVTEVQPGNRVLIEPLKWTSGIDVDGETHWRTDEGCILAVDDAVS